MQLSFHEPIHVVETTELSVKAYDFEVNDPSQHGGVS
jgi:hypothetical protein